jgi:transcriptional regulator with XRE-family HTH domain
MNIEIANRLVELRKKSGYSQEELAEKIGISRQAVSKWERAESSPDTDNLIALSRLYGVSLDALLYTEERIETVDERVTDELDSQIKTALSELIENEISEIKDKKSGGHEVVYPIIATIIFFIIGWTTNQWKYAWLVFLTVPVYYGIAEAVHRSKKRSDSTSA